MWCPPRAIWATAAVIGIGCSSADRSVPSAPDVSFARGGPSAPPFTPTALPTLGGISAAHGVNDAGVIVGVSSAGGVFFPVRWTQTGGIWQVSKLQTESGSAADINESGAVVGTSNDFATYWPASGAAETIGPGSPRALNDAGVVVGHRSGAPNGGAVAWTRSGGVWTEHTLPRQGGVTTGFNEVDDINNDGVVVGYAQGADGVQHAVKWVPSTTRPGEWDAAVPLDSRAATTNSAALGINGNDVVGVIWRCSTPSGGGTCTSREGYHWSITGGGIGSIAPGDVAPAAVNGSRYIVGWFTGAKGRQTYTHAFVWSPANPTIQDLGVLSGYGTTIAWAINNATPSRPARLAVGESQAQNAGANIAMVWTIP